MRNLPKTVLCYLKRDDSYLLLYRNKKKNDYNSGKWIGVGGHIEDDETPEEAAIREVKEETGFDVRSLTCSGEVIFVNNDYEEIMYVYEITDFDGEQIICDEGDLKWVALKDLYDYPMWEGDKAFLPSLINHAPYFKLKVIYKEKELIEVKKY